MKRISLCLILLSAAAVSQAPPDSTEQAAILAEVRRNALAYDSKLPDFVCEQISHRAMDHTGTGEKFEPIDTIEQRLTYFGKREHHVLLTR